MMLPALAGLLVMLGLSVLRCSVFGPRPITCGKVCLH
jgi:hypothetical protein